MAASRSFILCTLDDSFSSVAFHFLQILRLMALFRLQRCFDITNIIGIHFPVHAVCTKLCVLASKFCNFYLFSLSIFYAFSFCLRRPHFASRTPDYRTFAK